MYYTRCGKSRQGKVGMVGSVSLRSVKKGFLVLSAVVMLFLFCTGMSSGKAQKQYFEAVGAMDDGEYLEAIELFEALDGYKDSEEMVKECYYLYAGQLLEEGKIRSASAIYQDLSGYKDADVYIQKCSDATAYQEAQRLYENEEYMSAYLALGNMSGNYKDSQQLEAKCVCNITRAYYEDKDYKEAYNWLAILKDCKKYLPKETDTSFMQKIQIRYAENLINTEENKNIEEGLEILKSMKSTSEIKKLITKAEKQLKQNKYDIAAKHLKNKQYTQAVDGFAEIKDFSDAKKQWLTAMYEYVQTNKGRYEDVKSSDSILSSVRNGVRRFYGYAETLSKNNFKDSKAYYKKLTAWTVDIVMNDDVDAMTSATSVSKYSDMCAHLTLNGGPLDGETKIKYEFTFPDGKKTSGRFDDPWKAGYTGTCWCYYYEPEKGKTGICSVKIYDGNGNVIGKSSIKVR